MNDRPELVVGEALLDALRPLVAELVAQELQRRADDAGPRAVAPPLLTVAKYAQVHHATPAAVRARIRRGQLEAIRPPGVAST